MNCVSFILNIRFFSLPKFNSFKTKGNLTKHMESKAHFKKCLEKGINPQTTIDDSANLEEDQTNASTDQNIPPNNEDCDTISDDDSDGDEMENDMENEIESSGKRISFFRVFFPFF